jgi:hypothetical protein
MFLNNPNQYPLYRMTPLFWKVALEVMKIVKCTDVIACTSTLNAANYAVSCNADWMHPGTGKPHSSALYSIISAVSGDRKTTADSLVCGPIYKLDSEGILKHAEKIKAFKTTLATWSSINAGLLSRIKKLARIGENTAEAEAEVQAHAALEPIEPRLERLTRQDITVRPVFEALEGEGQSVAIFVDEGQIFLDSNVTRHLGVLNKIWDGASLLTYDRAKHDCIIVRNPRATISIMVQPAVLSKFLTKHGAIAHGSGHMARYLIARSPSNQGFRDPVTINPELVELIPFHNRIIELLQRYLDKTKVTSVHRDVVEFDDDAKLLWFQIAADVEKDIQPGRYLSDIGDFASKFMDQVGRIATTMHYFEGIPGKISRDTLRRAADIASWHLDEYKLTFSPDNQRSEESIDAESVYGYLYRHYYQRHRMSVSKNYIRQRCGVRGERYCRALEELMSMSAIGVQPGANNKQMIELNPQFFSSTPI